MGDISESLAAQVEGAGNKQQPLSIAGSGSKGFLLYERIGTPLSVTEHSGVIDYEPTELVITARAGTPIAAINQTLNDNQQMLAFDPPLFGGKATLGGAIASGLSGPARPRRGAARDFVLGSRIISGKGETLKFGGQVMKNVAGYDVSRLMTGAFGTLGVILDMSLKVLPKPEHVQTQVLTLPADQAIKLVNQLSGTPLPITGTLWHKDQLYIRLSGHTDSVSQAARQIGGETDTDANLWGSVRDHQHTFFTDNEPVWRVGIAPATPMLDVEGEWLIEWGGAQRWLKTHADADTVIDKVIDAGGHYGLWYGKDNRYLRQPLSGELLKLHQSLKLAFDPTGILNPRAFYPDF